MAISLSCRCGAEFEVDDTFAGQGVTCPECHQPLKAPAQARVPLRTSGYALASLVLALVLAFTVVGSVAAVVLGVIALVSIARHPDRVTGAGYAVCGIVFGAGFTALTLLALSRQEIFETARGQLRGGEVDRTGPMEVVRPREGFAITRPSENWGVASPDLVTELHTRSKLLLADPGKDAYLDVSSAWVGEESLDRYRERLLDTYRKGSTKDQFGNSQPSGFRLLKSQRLPPLEGAEVEEVVFDQKQMGPTLRYVVRLMKARDSGRVYVVRGWAFSRRFPRVQEEIQRGLDSFRLLRRPGGEVPDEGDGDAADPGDD